MNNNLVIKKQKYFKKVKLLLVLILSTILVFGIYNGIKNDIILFLICIIIITLCIFSIFIFKNIFNNKIQSLDEKEFDSRDQAASMGFLFFIIMLIYIIVKSIT